MTTVLACVDGSAYDGSVCDHAAWLAGRMDGGVDVLHVSPPARSAGRPAAANRIAHPPEDTIERAVGRLRESGVETVRRYARDGDFAEVAASLPAEMIVIGKRGVGSDQDRRRLGTNVDRLIRATETPVCLASQFFLPITKSLVLLDAAIEHRAAVELVASHPGFRRLELDLAVIGGEDDDPNPKLRLAEARLGSRRAKVFAIAAEGLTQGLLQHMESGRADLFVISRAVLFPAPEIRLRRIEEGGLWAWRTPVVVC